MCPARHGCPDTAAPLLFVERSCLVVRPPHDIEFEPQTFARATTLVVIRLHSQDHGTIESNHHFMLPKVLGVYDRLKPLQHRPRYRFIEAGYIVIAQDFTNRQSVRVEFTQRRAFGHGQWKYFAYAPAKYEYRGVVHGDTTTTNSQSASVPLL